MFTLVLKIRMNSDEVVDDKEEIYGALQTLVLNTDAHITDDEMVAMMKRALKLSPPWVDSAYEIVEG